MINISKYITIRFFISNMLELEFLSSSFNHMIRFSKSCISAIYCPILTMESLFIQPLVDMYILFKQKLTLKNGCVVQGHIFHILINLFTYTSPSHTNRKILGLSDERQEVIGRSFDMTTSWTTLIAVDFRACGKWAV